MNLEDLTEAERKEVLDLAMLLTREIIKQSLSLSYTIKEQAEQMSNTVRERSGELSVLIDNCVHIVNEAALGEALNQQEQESAAFPFNPQEPPT